jgi:pimeloyl-ACP methyl ester carboxylesterase
MKLIFLHGLGQRAHDWQPVVNCIPGNNVDCPELFLLPSGEKTYPHILAALEKRYVEERELLLLCGLSLGAVLALDYTIRHGDKVAGLVLIAPQYKVPGWLIRLQNWMFRCMPETAFTDIGMTRAEVIALCGSMQTIDFTAQLYRISCPVKLLCGGRDLANKAACRKLQKLLPQAELEFMPGIGHEMNREAPQAVAAEVWQLQNKIMGTAAGSSSALHPAQAYVQK